MKVLATVIWPLSVTLPEATVAVPEAMETVSPEAMMSPGATPPV